MVIMRIDALNRIGMENDIQERIDVLVADLSKKSESYRIAFSNFAGFDERRIILKEKRVIEKEIEFLKDSLKSPGL